MKNNPLSHLLPFLIAFFWISAPMAMAQNLEEEPQKESLMQKIRNSISGYYKTLTAFSKSMATKEGISSLLQRLRLEYNPRFTEKLSGHFVYDHELMYNDFSNTSDFDLIRQNNQKNYAWWDADQVITDRDHLYQRHLLFRAYIKYETEDYRVLFGKQLIDWGRMRFYSPLDIFNPPMPYSLEPDERVGFDALNFEIPMGDFTNMNVLYGPGTNYDRTSYGMRLSHKIDIYDTFLIVAKRREETITGVGVDGYLGDAGVRAEFTYSKDGKESYPRVAIGGDYNFPHRIYAAMEYFYNGAANGDYDAFSESLVESRNKLSLTKHLLSMLISHELTPLLKIKNTTIYDFRGESAFFNPELRYNLRENCDIACGAQLYVESKGSEFEGSNNLYYAELKYFF